jgi:amino acid adenylation domain-containing protein
MPQQDNIITKANLQDLYALSPLQEGMLFHAQLEPGSTAYFEQVRLRVSGPLSTEVFQQSWNILVQRHDVLRTVLLQKKDGKNLQAVLRQVQSDVSFMDLQDLPPAEQRAQLSAYASEDRGNPFEVLKHLLFRITLFRLQPDEHVLLFSFHHILMDGWSGGVLYTDLLAIYHALAEQQPLPPAPTFQYSRYIRWLDQQDQEAGQRYWQEYLDGYTDLATLSGIKTAPGLVPDDAEQLEQGLYQQVLTLDTETTAQLQNLAVQLRVTLHTLIQAVWGLLLGYYNASEDVVFGSTVSGRPAELRGIEQAVGLFINTIPVRIQIRKGETCSQLIRRIYEQTLAAGAYHHYPLAEIQAETVIQQNLFDHLLIFENTPSPEEVEDAGTSRLCLSQESFFEHTHYQLVLAVFPDARLRFKITYACSSYSHHFITQISKHYRELLGRIADKPEIPCTALNPLSTAEQEYLLDTLNRTAQSLEQQTWLEGFAASVAKYPAKTAVIFENEGLSYAELNSRANQLAHYILDTGAEVGPGALIGIYFDRSADMLIALLAVMKTGSAYVPLDPIYPQARLMHMINDASLSLLLTHSSQQSNLPASDIRTVCIDHVAQALRECSRENPQCGPQAQDAAYVIYTSGSTGKPKGVMIQHQALLNFLVAMQQEPGLTCQDILLAVTTISFDIAALELYLPLFIGAQVVIASRSTTLDGEQLASTLVEKKISILQATPATWRLLLQAGWAGNASLKILVGGEALPRRLALELCRRGVSVWNMYGPTETTIWSTVQQVKRKDTTEEQGTEGGEIVEQIGFPILNTRIYIVDQQLRLLPPGVAGELCIAGLGLSSGYLNRPELTAERFVEVGFFGKKERIYRTGDLARWLPNGNLEYLGRMDHQVKLRGFRIELGEIEAALTKHKAVGEAVVVLCEQEGNSALAAYITVLGRETNISTLELRAFLKQGLPDYMVPSSFTVLQKLPLTPNGKIDRKNLPAPDQSRNDGDALCSTESQRLLAGLYSDVLGIDVRSASAHFFEAGGHSLLAARLTSRIRDSFDVEMPLRILFEHPTVADLSAWLDQQQRGEALPPVEPQAEDAPLMLSFAQERLRFLARLEGSSATYNMPAAVRLRGKLRVESLRRTFVLLTERHQCLRMYFPETEGAVEILPPYDPLVVSDLTDISGDEHVAAVQERVQKHALRPFDLETGPLLSLELLVLGEEEGVLLFNMHHIISDGWSINILLREWTEIYTALIEGRELELRPLPVQYSDYAAWQRQVLSEESMEQQLAQWEEQLAGAPQLLELPTDHPRPAVQSYQGAHLESRISSDLTARLHGLGRAENSTLFMTLLTAFSILLHKYSGQDDILIGSPTANRTLSQLEDLIGLFVNTLVLRARFGQGISFTDLLAQVRRTVLDAFAHQDLPFERLVERLAPERSLSHSPLFQVMFMLQNNEEGKVQLPGLETELLEQEFPIAKFDLGLSALEQDGELILHWEYATDLFEKATVRRMAEHFTVLLEALVENPAQAIRTLSLLTPAEAEQLIAWNDTALEYPADKTLVDLFEEQVAKTPDNVAVVFEDKQLTYCELNSRANRLAALLIEHGVQRNTLVGICVERSPEMIISLWAVLKAGGAYIPLDPGYPKERLQGMIEDSAVQFLLTPGDLLEHLPFFPGTVIELDAPGIYAGRSEGNPARIGNPDDLAYVIYTSGSTGKPKGVQVTHSSISHFVYMCGEELYEISSEDVVLQFASFNFDASAEEIYPALTQGATLVLRTPDMISTNKEFLRLCTAWKITILDLPTAFWQQLIYEEDIENFWPDAVRLVIIGGEAASQQSVELWNRRLAKQACLVNTYGPTEGTVVATSYQLNIADTMLPIGRPFPNTQVHILNADHQRNPIGIPGELCIAGVGLAQGYLNRPELTGDKFVTVEIFGKTERVYKTGDLARWRSDGHLEYLGRIDHQVKLRGFRIELGEIESVLTQHEAVRDAVVVLYERKGSKSLTAYLTSSGERTEQLVPHEMRKWLKGVLPNYMIPTHFIVLDMLPHTPNGKIDRKALPEPKRQDTRSNQVLPRDTTELRLLELWQTVLDVDSLGVDNNFFDAGGHSLLAVRLMGRIEQQFDLRLPMTSLFQYPDVASLAEYLRRSAPDTDRSNLIPVRTQGQGAPVYLLPGAMGSVLYLQPLAAALGHDNPVYALQTPGLNDTECTPESIEAMAAYHIELLHSKGHRGPYYLIGHSAGGRVAFEMACQLERKGENVALLGVLDTNAPDPEQTVPAAEDCDEFWLWFFVQVVQEMTGVDLHTQLEDLKALHDKELAYAHVLSLFQQHELLFVPETQIVELKRRISVFRTAALAHLYYNPEERKVDCPLLVFRAQDRFPVTIGARNAVPEADKEQDGKVTGTHKLGWERYTSAGATEFFVPGNHFTMMTKPYVQHLADALKPFLQVAGK